MDRYEMTGKTRFRTENSKIILQIEIQEWAYVNSRNYGTHIQRNKPFWRDATPEDILNMNKKFVLNPNIFV